MSPGASRMVVTALLAGALGLVPVLGAWGEPQARITQIRSVDGEVVTVLTADGLGPGTEIDPNTVTMTINGEPVAPAVTSIGDEATRASQSAVLAIDASDSMAGRAIESAKEASLIFAENVPETVPIGLVTFAESAAVAVPPTTDRDTLTRAINEIETSSGTAVYDALRLSLEAVGDTDLRSVVLLSDGRDTASKTTFESILEQTRTSGATVDTVALGRFAGFADDLRAFSDASGGKFYTAKNAQALAEQFTAAAETLSNQLIVTAPYPSDLAGSGATVTIEAGVDGTTIDAEAFVTLSDSTVESGVTPADSVTFGPIPVEPAGVSVSTPVFVAGLIVAVLGLFVVLGVASLRYTRNEDSEVKVTSRLALYSVTGRAPVKQVETTAFGTSAAAQQAVLMARQMVRTRDFESTLETKLEASGIPLRPAEWVIVHVAASVGGGLLLVLLSGFSFVAGLVGIAVGIAVPWMYLSVKRDRRFSAFYEQLPDTLQLMASSLSAGYSLPQAMDTVAREGKQPIAAEFNRSLVETRLGVGPEDALRGIADRMGSKDFLWVVMAIQIQREVGGNLAGLLTTVAATLREREYLRRQVRVLSAEGRLSAWIVGALPVVFAIFLLVTRPDLLSVLWTDPRGVAMLLAWAVLMIVGIIWLRRVVEVEV